TSSAPAPTKRAGSGAGSTPVRACSCLPPRTPARTRAGCSPLSTTRAATPASSSCSTPPTSRARPSPPCTCPGGCRSASTARGCPQARSYGSSAPPRDERRLDVVGVGKHEHRPVGGADDRRVRPAGTVEVPLPHLQLGPARDAERQVVEPGAELVERRAVAPDRLPDAHLDIEAVVPHVAQTEL